MRSFVRSGQRVGESTMGRMLVLHATNPAFIPSTHMKVDRDDLFTQMGVNQTPTQNKTKRSRRLFKFILEGAHLV